MADILIVTDDEPEGVRVAAMLGRLGHELHFASTQDGAILLAAKREISVVVVDVALAGAIEVLPVLKASRSGLRVVALADTDAAEQLRTMGGGVDSVVMKPVVTGELVSAVEDALGVTRHPECPACGDPGEHTRTFTGLLCRACGRVFTPTG